jgi:hypothetical protein
MLDFFIFGLEYENARNDQRRGSGSAIDLCMRRLLVFHLLETAA